MYLIVFRADRDNYKKIAIEKTNKDNVQIQEKKPEVVEPMVKL